jgi:hypothetical protein
LADRFSWPGNGQVLPTVAELSHLSFDEVWLRLVDMVRPWQVTRLDLVAYKRGERSSEYSWCEPDVARLEHCCWSLGMSFPRNDGQRCELRATVHGSIAPSRASLITLTQTLRLFAVRFAIHPEAQLSLRLVRTEEADAAEAIYVSKAA